MFEKFINLLRSQGLLTLTEINRLSFSPCDKNSSTVLDFLLAKERFYGQQNKAIPKSVTGIVLNMPDRIYFVQTFQHKIENDVKNMEELIKEYSKEGIKNKVESTLYSLKEITSHYIFEKLFDSYYEGLTNKKISTLVLSKLTDRQYMNLKLSNLDDLNIGKKSAVLGDIKIIECQEIHKYVA